MPRLDPITIESIPYSKLPGFSSLFKAYCSSDPAVTRFFSGEPFSISAYEAVAGKVSEQQHNRSLLARVLSRQNASWHADESVARSIQVLERDGTLAVVTGQQLGLFGGPAYTLYKAISAIKLSRRLSSELGVPVVPIFWLADEDHDFDEVRSIKVPARDRSIKISLPHADLKGSPVGRMKFDYSAQLKELSAQIGGLPAGSQVMELLEESYMTGVSMVEAFARLLSTILDGQGLILMSGDDAEFKSAGASLFERAVCDVELINDGVARSSANLLNMGYHSQIVTRGPNLFSIETGRRTPIDFSDGKYLVDGRSLSQSEVLGMVRRRPEALSPNVVLRPIYQETLLPTIAYVGGPGETAYFAQLESVYSWAGVTMPVVHPRFSATVVSSKQNEHLERLGLDPLDLVDSIENRLADIASEEALVDWNSEFDTISAAITRDLSPLSGKMQDLDESLGSTFRSSSKLIQNIVARMQKKVTRSLKRQRVESFDRVRRTSNALFPNGKLQERTYPFVWLLAKFGTALVGDLLDSAEIDDTSSHFIVRQ